MPALSRRAALLAALTGSVTVLLVAAGCRSGEESDTSDARGEPALVSEAPAPGPSEPILSNTVTASTVLLASVSETDEPEALADSVAVTVVPDEPSDDLPELPVCNELEFEEGAVAELTETVLRWKSDRPPVTFGGRTVSAMHAPDPAWASSALGAAIYAQRADPRAYETQYLFVTVTSESGAEQTHRLPLAPPWEVHPSLRTAAGAGRIAATDHGWMIPVSVTTFMDSRLLVSPYFAEHAPGVISADPYIDEERQFSGLRIHLTGYHGYDGPDFPRACLASWAELGTTRELYDRYGEFVNYNKPYQDVGQESSYLWVSRWDGEPIQAELPGQWGHCCFIRELEHGYLIYSDRMQVGAPTWPTMAPGLHYSRDGFEWREVELPTRKFTFSDAPDHPDTEWFDIPIWVCSVESIDGGVLIREGQGGPADTQCGITRYWIADADLTNWRLHPDAANAAG